MGVGAAIRPECPTVLSYVTTSSESALLPAVIGVSPHLVDHVFVSSARPLESLPHVPPDIRLPALPSDSKTTASIPWLRSPHARAVEGWNKTLARRSLRASESFSLSLPLQCPAS